MCEGGKNKNSNENTIFFYSFGAGERNENKESRSFRTIWERSLYAWELFGSNTHTPKRETRLNRADQHLVAEPVALLSIVDRNSHPAVQANIKNVSRSPRSFHKSPRIPFRPVLLAFFFEWRQAERKKTQKVQ